MSKSPSYPGSIRKLRRQDHPSYADHLLRLDKDSRRMRFAHTVSDSYIDEYAKRMGEHDSIVYGYFEETEIRAVAELKKLGDTWGREAEAAFSVEKPHQQQGIGTDLMGKIIRSARNRGVQSLYMSCLAENAKMQTIARKYDAELRFEFGEVIGEIIPQYPDYFSILEEQFEDRVGFLMTVLNLNQRAAQAA